MNASKNNTTKRYRLDPKKPRRLTQAETRQLEALPIDYSDIPPLGEEFFRKAAATLPPTKEQLTIRLDKDVLEWLRATGKGYHTRINHILRAAMEGHLRAAARGQPLLRAKATLARTNREVRQ